MSLNRGSLARPNYDLLMERDLRFETLVVLMALVEGAALPPLVRVTECIYQRIQRTRLALT